MSKSITKEQYDALYCAIKSTCDDDLVKIHNFVCNECGYVDSEIFPMDFIDDIVCIDGCTSALDVWQRFSRDFNPTLPYFWIDGYGRVSSCDAYEAVCLIVDEYIIADEVSDKYTKGSLDKIADYIKDTPIADWVDWMESEDTDDAEAAD